jgi:hypothetical protein
MKVARAEPAERAARAITDAACNILFFLDIDIPFYAAPTARGNIVFPLLQVTVTATVLRE